MILINILLGNVWMLIMIDCLINKHYGWMAWAVLMVSLHNYYVTVSRT